jgi:hypothetical protein
MPATRHLQAAELDTAAAILRRGRVGRLSHRDGLRPGGRRAQRRCRATNLTKPKDGRRSIR